MKYEASDEVVSSVSRRDFLGAYIAKAVSVGVVTQGVCSLAMGSPKQDDEEIVLPLTKAKRDALSPEQIIAAIKAGNERFSSGKRHHRDLLIELKKTADGQSPTAVILGCIDSRAPAEIIFDLGLGDIFNCRVAGNIENPDILGSIEFATKVSGAKVITVLGHSACGAIKGAIDDAELGNLSQLLAKIKPAVAGTKYEGERSSRNAEFVDLVARKNVQLTLDRIRKGSAILVEMERAKQVKLIGGFYNLASGKVEFLA